MSIHILSTKLFPERNNQHQNYILFGHIATAAQIVDELQETILRSLGLRRSNSHTV